MRKHSHYFKDVSKLGEIDVYRVCALFQINDPSGATQHALKKILLPGLRGGKCTRQDMQEAIDTLTRRIQMLDEDAGCNEASIMAAGFGHKNMIEPVGPLWPGIKQRLGGEPDMKYRPSFGVDLASGSDKGCTVTARRDEKGAIVIEDVRFDEARADIIAQNGNDGAHYSEIDRLRAAADFNDDVPVEPQRPRHVCPACGLGHSIGQCNPMTVEEAVALGGKHITEVAE